MKEAVKDGDTQGVGTIVQERLRGSKSLPVPRQAGGVALRGAYRHEQQVRNSERGGPLRVRPGGNGSPTVQTEAVAPEEAGTPELKMAQAAAQSGHLLVSHSTHPANDAAPGPENFFG